MKTLFLVLSMLSQFIGLCLLVENPAMGLLAILAFVGLAFFFVLTAVKAVESVEHHD